MKGCQIKHGTKTVEQSAKLNLTSNSCTAKKNEEQVSSLYGNLCVHLKEHLVGKRIEKTKKSMAWTLVGCYTKQSHRGLFIDLQKHSRCNVLQIFTLLASEHESVKQKLNSVHPRHFPTKTSRWCRDEQFIPLLWDRAWSIWWIRGSRSCRLRRGPVRWTSHRLLLWRIVLPWSWEDV